MEYTMTIILSLDSIIELIFFTLYIPDSDVMSFTHDSLGGIYIFYDAIKFQMFNSSRVVELLIQIQQPILKFDKLTINEYNLIISEYQFADFVSPVLFYLYAESLSKVENSDIYNCIFE